jgi:hypothetical protein
MHANYVKACMKIIRTHDKLYLKENRYKKPKEIFKFIYNLIKKSNHNKNKKVITDFGCAAGEFLFFLKPGLIIVAN